MTDVTQLTKEQLRKELRKRKSVLRDYNDTLDQDVLLHELQVHQIELEMQNRELLDSQQALEEARDRYSDLYDFSPIGYVTLDQHACIQDINLTACQMIGKERAQITGKPFTVYLSQHSKQKFLQHLRNVFLLKDARNKSVETELNIITSTQTQVDIRLKSIAVDNAFDNGITCRSAIIDIGDELRVRQKLHEQSNFAENIIETASSIVLVLDTEGKIVRVNSFFEKLTGYKRAEILGKDSFTLLIPEQERKKIRERFRSALDGVHTVGFVNCILTRSGKEKYIEWYDAEQKDRNGEVIGLLAIGLDITPRIEAEVSNYESQHQLRLLTNSLPVVIAYVDAQQQIRYHNQYCSDWLDRAGYEINGKSIRAVFGDAVYVSLSPLIESVLAGERVSASFELLLAQDNKRFVMANFVPNFDQRGNAKGFFFMLNDITTYRQEELKDKHRLVSLAHESRLNVLGEMASEIAHELNQPLAAISNFADACLRLYRDDKLQEQDITEILTDIKAQTLHANQIIRHIRDFTQKRELQLHNVDINTLIKEVLQLIAGGLNLQNINVVTRLTEANSAVIADGVLLKQVMLNLLNNAVEAMVGANVAHPQIIITTTADQQHISIDVADNGPGVPEAMGEKIFKPFFTTKDEGMGLGLSMCQSIIESHGGYLLLRNNSPGGATLTVRLPISPSAP